MAASGSVFLGWYSVGLERVGGRGRFILDGPAPFPFVPASSRGSVFTKIKKPGSLRKELGAKAGETIPAKRLAAAAKKPGKLGQRGRLAETLKKMK